MSLNCGTCLLERVELVPLRLDGTCPKCAPRKWKVDRKRPAKLASGMWEVMVWGDQASVSVWADSPERSKELAKDVTKYLNSRAGELEGRKG